MARPTNDPKPCRVDLRISEEMHNKLTAIARQTDQSIAEYVRNLIAGDKVSGENKEVASMIKTFGISYEEFMNEVAKMLEEGLIYNDCGLKTREHDLDVSNFKEKCDALGIGYQAALDKLSKGMR